jgi:hypothetical protein
MCGWPQRTLYAAIRASVEFLCQGLRISVWKGHLEQQVVLPPTCDLEVCAAVLDEAVPEQNPLGHFLVDQGLCLEPMEAESLRGDPLGGSDSCRCNTLTVAVLGHPIADARGLERPSNNAVDVQRADEVPDPVEYDQRQRCRSQPAWRLSIGATS